MTTKHNPENERLKRAYLIYMREAQQHGEQSLDAIAKALHRFESYTKFRPFRTFHPDQAMAFKSHLGTTKSERSGATLSFATQYATLAALKAFFRWLVAQPGFKRRLKYSDAAYFNMPRGHARIAKTHSEGRGPTLEQARHVLAKMPASTDMERRDRAVYALVLLTGARDGAIPSLKRKHLDLLKRQVCFDAREVRTKFSKSFSTRFFPVGEEAVVILEQWATYLDAALLWGPGDPLFPSTKVEAVPGQGFKPIGLTRDHWKTAGPIRDIFRKAFARADLPYFGPHSFRNTLTRLGERICQSPEQFKAWSQNLGHERVLTTLTSYGAVAPDRQAEIIRDLANFPASQSEAIQDLLRAAERVSSEAAR